MTISPRAFRHLYAAGTGILAGVTMWWLTAHFIPSSPLAIVGVPPDGAAVPVLYAGESRARPVRTVAFVTNRKWYLTKLPNKDALDGYELYLHDEHAAIDTEKQLTAWEQLMLMQYQQSTSPVQLIPLLTAIPDQHDQALAIQMVLSLLRTGIVPAHPIHMSDAAKASALTAIEPAIPSYIAPAPSDSPLPRPSFPAPLPLTDSEQRAKEAAWRTEIEATRRPIIDRLNAVELMALKLAATPLTATLHLSIADNYFKLLEPEKGSKTLTNAADCLKLAYASEHAFGAVAWPVVRDQILPLLLALLVYIISLNHDLYKKLSEHYTRRRLLKWWPNGDLAATLGTTLPKDHIILTDGAAETVRR